MLDNLDKYRILLASASPRRRELLAQMQIKFDVVLLNSVDESYPESLDTADIASFISQQKAKAYCRLIKDNELLITADTIVICDGVVLGKPENEAQAVEMLMFMSGKTHKVVTGVTITTVNDKMTFDVTTDVTFATITPDEAEYYVSKFRPLDKAGAYGIQEWIGAVAVKSIHGSFYNVMGLPIHQLYNALKQF